MTSDAATLRQVGRPKLRFPTSEKTWAVIFFSFVQRTTSHGACGVSASSGSCWNSRLLDRDDWRECADRKAGDAPRGVARGDGDSREEKRRSKGCRAGLFARGSCSCRPRCSWARRPANPGSTGYHRGWMSIQSLPVCLLLAATAAQPIHPLRRTVPGCAWS